LEQGLVFVQLDPRDEGVVVPDHLRSQLPLGLNLSRNFHLETFEIDDEGVRASLSFKGVRSLCVLPWSAVFLMSADDKTYVFEESFPKELAAALKTQRGRGAPERSDLAPPDPPTPEPAPTPDAPPPPPPTPVAPPTPAAPPAPPPPDEGSSATNESRPATSAHAAIATNPARNTMFLTTHPRARAPQGRD
jgi:hypothetical protein